MVIAARLAPMPHHRNLSGPEAAGPQGTRRNARVLGTMVRSRRLELPRVAPQRPQRCASTNSATTARGEARGLAEASENVKRAEQRAISGGPGGAPRIAVLVDREGMGDVILKAPFLRALRRAFPGHAVWW